MEEIKRMQHDLELNRVKILRHHKVFNMILNTLFSSLKPEEKNKKIGWLIVNEKIDDTEQSHE